MKTNTDVNVIFIEINEADLYFLDKFMDQGRLPTFAKMRREGAFVVTRIKGWEKKDERSWREIMPWVIWPTLYSGIPPETHGILAFGQDTKPLQGKCVWDVLDANGVSVGIVGSLQSYPPRNQGHAAFYIPDALADDASCFPEEARPFQEFCVMSARNYSENFVKQAGIGTLNLLKSAAVGVTPRTIAKTLIQIPLEKIMGGQKEAERSFIASDLMIDAFFRLYAKYRPRYAALHLNHVAYNQHRYWRAAEPSSFPAGLSETDQRFFRSEAERDAYEVKLAHQVENAFIFTDALLARTLKEAPDNTIVLVGTALGQEPCNPITEIHNPVVRLVKEYEFFDALGLRGYRVLHQMNPDLTITFESDADAEAAETKILTLYVNEAVPLFYVDRRAKQLFCEFRMPKGLVGRDASSVYIQSTELPSLKFSFAKHVSLHNTNDQSTAQHHDKGWMLAYSRDVNVKAAAKECFITEVAPSILSLFGVAAPDWMSQTTPIFTVTERPAPGASS